MKQNKEKLKKWIMLILFTIVVYWCFNNFSTIGNIFNNIINIIFPFILGGCLAFILNIPMTYLENKNKKIRNKKLLRVFSLIFSIIIIASIITLIFTLIVPRLADIVGLLIDNIPYYSEQISNFVKDLEINMPELSFENVDTESIKDQIINQVPGLLTSSITVVTNIVSGIANFFIAFIFAIYILIDKEKLRRQFTKLLYAYLDRKKAYKIIKIAKVSNNVFKSFFTVQCLEATILGTLCIIGMLILGIPYAVPIGILIGVTALIPVVGAFIGVIIGAILIISVEPFKVITFIIFVLVLQQIEGNLIYPRVVGNSVGLPGMWVLLAVTVGGNVGGIVGMLLGVPIASTIYTLLKSNVDKRIRLKEIKDK